MEIFRGFTTYGLLEQIQEFLKERECDPEQFEGRIIFMSMFNDIVWKEDKAEKCKRISHEVVKYARRIPRGHWSFLGPG